MSTLLLIRHGQARAFERDSDRLSDIGAEQAARLGSYFVQKGMEFDEVYTGTLVRQRGTAEIVRTTLRAAGRSLPDSVEDAAWNEYDADGVVGKLLPALAGQDAHFAGLVGEFQARAGSPDKNRYFQRMFEVLMDHWQRGAVGSEGVEPFEAFHSRVRGVLQRLLAKGGSRRVAVFTSGGPIGVSVQELLGAPAASCLRLNFRVKNTSITEVLFSEGRASLDGFNAVEHLPQELRTFRWKMPPRSRKGPRSTNSGKGGFQVGPGTLVTLSYELFDAEGELVEASEPGTTVSFLIGYGDAAPALERGLEGLSEGDERELILSPDDAFGPRDPDALIRVERADLPAGVGPGDEFEAERQDGAGLVPLKVVEVLEDTVVLDTNHPLSGQRVKLRVTVEAVRPATEEEMAQAAKRLSEPSESKASSQPLLPAERLLRRKA